MNKSTIDIDRPIGQRIREAREFRGINQSDLAARIGKTKGGLSQIESGEVWPAHSTLVAIAKILEMSIELIPLPSKSDEKTKRKK